MPTEANLAPGDRWVFDQEVADAFDDMLERSIPQYETMREATTEIGRRFVQPGSTVVDLGCSRGGAMAPLVEAFSPDVDFVGCEVSGPMRAAARERFRDRPDVEILDTDLRTAYPPVGGRGCSLTLAVLTLQFVPINYRQRIVSDAGRSTVPGGAFVLVEKVLGASARLDDAFVDAYHEAKHRAGYTREEIERKRLSLEGVLVPLTDEWNVELLRRGGFSEVDCFWAWMNFRAWVAVR